MLRHDLLRSWPHSLRFELSRSGTQVQMFSRALERTLAISRFAFGHGAPISVVLRFYQREARVTGKPAGLVALAKCGFELPAGNVRREHVFKEHVPPKGSMKNVYEYTYRFAGHLEDANCLAVIWAILGNELGISPTAAVSGYFVAEKSGLVLHPYDDRGKDVVADDPAPLRAIGQHFHEWLIDCRPAGFSLTMN